MVNCTKTLALLQHKVRWIPQFYYYNIDINTFYKSHKSLC